MNEDNNVVENIKNIEDNINELLEDEVVDKEKLFKLRYQQMIQGLYLTDEMIINN